MGNTSKSNKDIHLLINKVDKLEKKVASLEQHIDRVRPKEKLLEISQACLYLEVSRMTLYRYMDQGLLGYTKVGKTRRIALAELDKFISGSRIEAKPSIL